MLLGYAAPLIAYGGGLVLWLPGEEGLRRTWLLSAVSRPAAILFPVLILAAGITSYVLARDPAARQRMRLVTYALGILAGGYLLLGRIPDSILGHPLVGWDYFSLVVIPAQLLVAAAVLRYRLWDIQIMLRRSLVYGLVTIGLIIVYLLVAAGLGAVLDTRLGVVHVLLAVVVALSFSLARAFLRRLVSRLVYGAREDPYEVLRQLGRRLESAGSAEVVLNDLASTLVRTLRLAHASVEVPGLDVAARGERNPGTTATYIDLVHDGERIGRLVLDPGPDREPFGASDRRLLEGLAQHVSLTAYRLLLAAKLQRSLEGTVTVLEEERRRIRREIHDGLGPTIASASMRLELGRSLVRTDPAAAERILADLADVHRSVVDDIRELVDGLRPTILDHLGLEAALREQVDGLGGSVRVELDCATGAEQLPAAVEVAAYRIVSEALTNVARHARASACAVRVWCDGDLHIEVRDDGVGLPHGYRPGMGLTSIRERCAELGGAARIGANEPTGTVVRCRLPLLAGAGRETELLRAGGRLSRARRSTAQAPPPRSGVVGVPAS
jgi:signal transduction histidine kinase